MNSSPLPLAGAARRARLGDRTRSRKARGMECKSRGLAGRPRARPCRDLAGLRRMVDAARCGRRRRGERVHWPAEHTARFISENQPARHRGVATRFERHPLDEELRARPHVALVERCSIAWRCGRRTRRRAAPAFRRSSPSAAERPWRWCRRRCGRGCEMLRCRRLRRHLQHVSIASGSPSQRALIGRTCAETVILGMLRARTMPPARNGGRMRRKPPSTATPPTERLPRAATSGMPRASGATTVVELRTGRFPVLLAVRLIATQRHGSSTRCRRPARAASPLEQQEHADGLTNPSNSRRRSTVTDEQA